MHSVAAAADLRAGRCNSSGYRRLRSARASIARCYQSADSGGQGNAYPACRSRVKERARQSMPSSGQISGSPLRFIGKLKTIDRILPLRDPKDPVRRGWQQLESGITQRINAINLLLDDNSTITAHLQGTAFVPAGADLRQPQLSPGERGNRSAHTTYSTSAAPISCGREGYSHRSRGQC